MIPDWSASTVFLPITWGGRASSTLSNCAARRERASTEISIPGARAPPTKSPRLLTASKLVDVPKSTNFDAVSSRGDFVGGALAPGIEISVDALSRRAAQLLKVELARPPHVIGKNTVEALQSGIIYGFAGQVEGIARRMVAELAPEDPDSVTVIATGGLAPLVLSEISVIDAHEPWLTLIGLRLVFERNIDGR